MGIAGVRSNQKQRVTNYRAVAASRQEIMGVQASRTVVETKEVLSSGQPNMHSPLSLYRPRLLSPPNMAFLNTCCLVFT